MNHELTSLYGESNDIQIVTNAAMIRWTGHVIIIPDNNPVKIVIASNLIGTRKHRSKLGGLIRYTRYTRPNNLIYKFTNNDNFTDDCQVNRILQLAVVLQTGYLFSQRE